jgi:hypothetical protein
VTVEPSDACGDLGASCVGKTEDVVHVSRSNGNPSESGALLAEEWLQLGTFNARITTPAGAIATRGTGPCPENPAAQCTQVRTTSPGDEAGKVRYFVTVGASAEDPNLEVIGVADTIKTGPLGVPRRSGPLADALAPWQNPPPQHGSTYNFYETVNVGEEGEPVVTTRWWFDAATSLPLREVLSLDSSGGIQQPLVSRVYFSYDQTPYSSETLPANEFLLDKPSNAEQEWVHRAGAELEAPTIVNEEAP